MRVACRRVSDQDDFVHLAREVPSEREPGGPSQREAPSMAERRGVRVSLPLTQGPQGYGGKDRREIHPLL